MGVLRAVLSPCSSPASANCAAREQPVVVFLLVIARGGHVLPRQPQRFCSQPFAPGRSRNTAGDVGNDRSAPRFLFCNRVSRAGNENQHRPPHCGCGEFASKTQPCISASVSPTRERPSTPGDFPSLAKKIYLHRSLCPKRARSAPRKAVV